MSTSIQPNAPFRADIVGSFLRPQAVKDARAAYTAGTLDAEGLKAVEDDAIRDLVARQKAAGLQVITDGEFRRSYWHLDFMWGLNGVERRTSRTGYMFHDEETTADTAVVTGPISGENHPFVEHFKFVKALEGGSGRATDHSGADPDVLRSHARPLRWPAGEPARRLQDRRRSRRCHRRSIPHRYCRPVCRRLPQHSI